VPDWSGKAGPGELALAGIAADWVGRIFRRLPAVVRQTMPPERRGGGSREYALVEF